MCLYYDVDTSLYSMVRLDLQIAMHDEARENEIVEIIRLGTCMICAALILAKLTLKLS